jgi:hypothetical protein
VEVISFGRSSSTKLRESCEDFIDMCDAPEKYLMGYRVRRAPSKKTKGSTNKKSSAQEFSNEELGIFTGEDIQG